MTTHEQPKARNQPEINKIWEPEGEVRVNQRALVRKILSRYSYDFSVFREFLQNSDDAGSDKVTIRFEKSSDIAKCIVENTGDPFSKEDWSRITEIANGNPDSGKVGAFGVGFYSIFSLTDQPVILSGGRKMEFHWEGDAGPLRYSSSPLLTPDKGAIIHMPLKNPEIPEMDDLFRFLATSITFMTHLKNVEVFLNEDFIGRISKSKEKVDDNKPLDIEMKPVSPSDMRFLEPLRLQRRQFTIEYFPDPDKRPNVSSKLGLSIFSIEAGVEMGRKLEKELFQSTFKDRAPQVKYSLIYTGKYEYDQSSTDTTGYNSIFRELRADLNDALCSKIFIGHSTRQTTGIGGHMESQFIPTVERESIDLVDKKVAIWNNSLLYLGSFLSRVVYESELCDIQKTWIKLNEPEASKTPNFRLLHERFIHVLKFFAIRPSTPSPKVAEKLRESFYECSTFPLKLLSSIGVRQVSHIRRHDYLCEKFLKDVPMLSSDSDNLAADFVKAQLKQEIQRIEPPDVKDDLQKDALDCSKGELVACLRWILREWAVGAGDLLKVARFRDANRIEVPLSSIRHFIIPRRDGIPLDGPLPRSVLPHQIRVTQSIAPAELEKFGWREFTVIDWLLHVSSQAVRLDDKGEHDFAKSPHWAERVLRCISSAWSSGDDIRKRAVDVFKTERCIPTTHGLRIPERSCLPNSNITRFDNLDFPMVQLPSGDEISEGMAELLITLGVKKHPPIELVLKQEKWEISALIDYLVHVFTSLSDSDVERLKSAPIFAKKGNSKDGKTSFRADQLYPPTEIFQRLGLPLIDWGGSSEWHADSPCKEVELLYRLDLNRFPPLEEIIKLSQDAKVCEFAFEYLCNNLQKFFLDCTFENIRNTAFIPMENMDGIGLGKPGEVFLDRRWKILYLPVIRSGYQESVLEDLGVQRDPPSFLLLQQLEKLAEGSVLREKFAPGQWSQILSILSDHVSRFQKNELDRISGLRIVPYINREGKKMMLTPVECYLGQSMGHDLYPKLFHFVDLEAGEKFLLACGAKKEPTKEDVAIRLSDDPERFLSLAGGHEQFLRELRHLASEHTRITNATIGKMKIRPVLLGIIKKPKDAYVLKEPKEVVVVDDERAFQLFSDSIIAAPRNMSPELEEFYKLLGCQLLTTAIRDQPDQCESDAREDPSMCNEYRDLVLERLPIFLHNYPRPKPGTPAARFSGANALTVRIWQKLSVSKILTVAKNTSTKKRSVSATTTYKENTIHLSLTYDVKEDKHDLAVSLCRAFLGTEHPPDVEFLTTCLCESLDVLKRREYKVDQQHLDDWGLPRGPRPANSSTQIAPLGARFPVNDPTGRISTTEADLDSTTAHMQSQSATNQSCLLGGTEYTSRSCTASPATFPFQVSAQIAKGKEETSCEVHKTLSGTLTPILCQSPDLVMHQEHIESTIGAAIQACGSGQKMPLIHHTDPKVNKFLNSYCGVSALVNDLKFFRRVRDVEVYVARDFPNVNANSTWVPEPLSCFLIIIQHVAAVYGLSAKSIRIFYHATAGCIAFNHEKTIYLNLQYFEKWHYKDVSDGKQRRALTLWFLTFAHEIAHNLVSGHDSEHEFWFLAICEQYMDKFSQCLVSVSS